MLTSPPRHLTFRGSARVGPQFPIGLGQGGHRRDSGVLSSVDVTFSRNSEPKSDNTQ